MANMAQEKSQRVTGNGSAESLKDRAAWVVAIVGLLTFIFSAWQFFEKQGDANREPFLRKQMDLAFETSKTVATLASTSDPKAWEEARLEFWMLYWGPLSIVENQAVKNKMMELGAIVPQGPDPGMNSARKRAMQDKSYELAQSMRQLMLESWGADLPTLQNGSGPTQKP